MKYLAALLVGLFISYRPLSAEPFFAPASPGGEVLALDVPPGFDEPLIVYLASGRGVTSNVSVGIAGPPGIDAEVLSGSLRGGIRAAQGALTPAPILSVTSNTRGELQIAEGVALFAKDACRAKGRSVMQVTIQLRGIDPALRAQGFRVLAMLREERYRGPTAASIKPSADGKFAPQPLLLMSSISAVTGGKEAVFQFRFRGALAPKIRQVPIADYIWYKNLLLTRSPIEKLIREGGKSNFVMVGERYSYGVCFEMVRRRQSLNGYPLD